MLKITKGLNADGITTYTDDEGNRYVRVKMDGEDFCIALHDYKIDLKPDITWNWDKSTNFTWNDAMKSVRQEGMELPTKKQAMIYINHRNDINSVIREIGGYVLRDRKYWTSSEDTDGRVWSYNIWSNAISSGIDKNYKDDHLRVRPIINLQ